MRIRLARVGRSARFWALTMMIAAATVAFVPKTAAADGGCGCQACMTPYGYCIGVHGTICYYGTLYGCEYDVWGCAALQYRGHC